MEELQRCAVRLVRRGRRPLLAFPLTPMDKDTGVQPSPAEGPLCGHRGNADKAAVGQPRPEEAPPRRARGAACSRGGLRRGASLVGAHADGGCRQAAAAG